MQSVVDVSLLFNVPCWTLRDLRGSNYRGNAISILIFFIIFVMTSLVLEFNKFLQLPQLLENSLVTFSMCEVHSRHGFSLLVIFLRQKWQFITLILISVGHIFVTKELLPGHCLQCTSNTVGIVTVQVSVPRYSGNAGKVQSPILILPSNLAASPDRTSTGEGFLAAAVYSVPFCYRSRHLDIYTLLK